MSAYHPASASLVRKLHIPPWISRKWPCGRRKAKAIREMTRVAAKTAMAQAVVEERMLLSASAALAADGGEPGTRARVVVGNCSESDNDGPRRRADQPV